MKITRLNINHYKTIEEPVAIEHFSNLHVLIGPNNSGKTNILDALELFFSPDLNPERFYDSHSDLGIELDFETGERLEIKYYQNQRTYLLNRIAVTGEEARVQESQRRVIRIKPEISVHKLINYDLRTFEEQYPADYQNFCESLQRYFDDIEISTKLFQESIHTDRMDRPIERMGEGFKRLFVMLFYIFHPDFHIILIDEPEMHLHPSVLKRFLQLLMDTNLNNQVFLTTHSPVFVQPAVINHLWRVCRNSARHTQIYNLASSGMSLDPARLAQELDDDNSEMFFSDRVLLVEGISDKLLMRGLINRFYQGRKNIKVICAGGKDNLDTYIQLLHAFNIPYSVMLDRDALSGSWSDFICQALIHHHRAGLQEKIDVLKQYHIFILKNTLEKAYPRKYQKHDTKPLNALNAAANITDADLAAERMQVIKQVIENL